MNIDEAKGSFAELLNIEPHNSWYSAAVDRTTGRPVVRVSVSEHFLQSHDHQMKVFWDAFSQWKTRQIAEKSYAPKYVREKTNQYSFLIQGLCGCTGEAIYQKLQYLQQNNGIDRFGREINGART